MKRLCTDSNCSNKKLKIEMNGENTLCLDDMPMEILEEIVNKLTFWEFGRVRGTCLRFRNAADNILIRKLMHNMITLEDNPTNIEFICSKVFYQLAWPYIRYGYRSTAAGVYLSLMHSLMYSNSTEKFPPFLDTYIISFCQCIDNLLGDPLSHTSRLLYVVTILGFLNKLVNVECTEKQVNSKKLKLRFTMNGSLFGLLWARTQRNNLVYPDDRNTLIIFLADTMTSNIIQTPIRKMWENECSNRIVIFGNELVTPKAPNVKASTVFLDFTINGSKNLIEFFRTAPGAREWDELPTDSFTVSLNITCKEAHKLGCPTNYTFKIQNSF